jgi:hypothetical protein
MMVPDNRLYFFVEERIRFQDRFAPRRMLPDPAVLLSGEGPGFPEFNGDP